MASKDLDKLMGKLKKKEEKPKEEENDHEDDDLEDDLDNDQDEDTNEGLDQSSNSDDGVISGEVGVLQNDGIFRRELLLTLKEMILVQKAIAKTLIELKEKFDEEDGTK